MINRFEISLKFFKINYNYEGVGGVGEGGGRG